MWSTDLTTTWIGGGQVAVFVAVDHHSAECVGIHAACRATRFEALEPIRQGVRHSFGAFGRDTARGFAVRHDHGSQYMSDAFQGKLAFLGIESSPAFVRAPEGNGCAERFIRTLKENLLWVRSFDTVEGLRRALLAFRHTYNSAWLIERHGFRPPAAIRAKQLSPAALAAQAPPWCLNNRGQYWPKPDLQLWNWLHEIADVRSNPYRADIWAPGAVQRAQTVGSDLALICLDGPALRGSVLAAY